MSFPKFCLGFFGVFFLTRLLQWVGAHFLGFPP